MDTSASIARDLMMEMVNTGQFPAGSYPNCPTLPAAETIKTWWEGMGTNYVMYLDQPAVTAQPFFPSGNIVDPFHTGVTLAYWSDACAKGLTTPRQIDRLVTDDPYLVPSSVCNLSSTAFQDDWRTEISPKLAPDNLSPSDDPWEAFGVPGTLPPVTGGPWPDDPPPPDDAKDA